MPKAHGDLDCSSKYTGPERRLVVRVCAQGHTTKRGVMEPCPICETHLGGGKPGNADWKLGYGG